MACPSHSYSVEGSARIDQCYCNPGYRQTPSHDACSECNPGYYDSITDRYECSKCAGGLYSAAVAATGVETCKPCEAGTWSQEGSPTCQVCPAYSNSTRGSALLTNCSCNPGASGSNGATCVLCPAGKFKAGSGSAACTDCPVNSISFSTNCQCKAGFMANGGTCSACSAGKFKATTGTDSCTTCPANTSSAGSVLINPSESLRTVTSSWGTRTTSALGSSEGWFIADYYEVRVTTSALATTSQHVQINLEFLTNV